MDEFIDTIIAHVESELGRWLNDDEREAFDVVFRLILLSVK